MGLDVYLYRYEDYAATERLEKEAESWSEHVWAEIQAGRKYEDLSDAEKEQARARTKAWNAEHGLDEWGSDDIHKRKVEIDSAIDPTHYFKIGYFRSSYNDSGINRLMRNAIGKDLGDLFPGSDGDAYAFRPDWQESLDLTLATLAEWREKVAADGAYRVTRIGWNQFQSLHDWPIDSEQAALAKFLETANSQKARHANDADPDEWTSFSTREGMFFLGPNPPVFRGFMQGTEETFVGRQKMPCVYAIYEDHGVDWYFTALEIVAETCRWVLAQSDAGKYYLHWSS